MNQRPLHKILYGHWRPWTQEGTEKFMDNHEVADLKKKDSEFEYFWKVNTSEPEGRLSFAYDEYIRAHLHSWYFRVIRNIEDAGAAEDRQYRYNLAKRDLLGVLQDIPDIREQVQYHPEEKENPISRFVLDVMSLRLVNILLDFEKRHPELTTESHTVEEIYLRLLDRKQPKPSPHQLTAAWYKKQVHSRLRLLRENKQSDASVPDEVLSTMRELYGVLAEKPADGEDYRAVTVLLHHLENALFLWLMEASFLDGHPGRLMEADFCREWVQQMIIDLVSGEDEMPVHDRIKQLMQVRTRFEGYLGYGSRDEGVSLSEARRWLRKAKRLGNPWVETVGISSEATTAYKGMDMESLDPDHLPNAFVLFFQRTYVHKQDVERVMGIGNKTLRKYLEMSDTSVRKIKIKQNVWFFQEDLKRLLEEFAD